MLDKNSLMKGKNVFPIASLAILINYNTSFYSYARPAQPGPNRTRLCGPCIAAIAGD